MGSETVIYGINKYIYGSNLGFKLDHVSRILHKDYVCNKAIILPDNLWKRQNWKWKMEMENGNSQNLTQVNFRVKPFINDHLLKTTSVHRSPRPHSN